MLHVQLQRFPHSARAFNLSEEEVRATITGPWQAGRLIELGERFWSPGECKLTILEGPALPPGELGLGRGWTAARKGGRDVTDELVRAPGVADPRKVAAGPPFTDFKDEVLARAARAPVALADIWRLAAARYPERALSDCLGLAERAVGELVHDELATLAESAVEGPAVERPAVERPAELARLMRARGTWAPAGVPTVSLRATARGERACGRG